MSKKQIFLYKTAWPIVGKDLSGNVQHTSPKSHRLFRIKVISKGHLTQLPMSMMILAATIFLEHLLFISHSVVILQGLLTTGLNDFLSS